MPDNYRWHVNDLSKMLEPLVYKGLKSIMLFGVVDESEKDSCGSKASDSPVNRALVALKKDFPDLFLITDLCICPYTSHGHCGILHEDGSINNTESVKRLGDIALSYI